MKKMMLLGKALSRNELKQISGGTYPYDPCSACSGEVVVRCCSGTINNPGCNYICHLPGPDECSLQWVSIYCGPHNPE